MCGTDAGLPAGTEDILRVPAEGEKKGAEPAPFLAACGKMAAQQSHYDLFEQLECARRPAAHSSSSSSARAALPPTVLTL